MQVDFRQDGPKWIVYVWDDDELQDIGQPPQYAVYDEAMYVDMNNWCVTTFGSHARTAYNVFEFNKKVNLEWFLLRWS